LFCPFLRINSVAVLRMGTWAVLLASQAAAATPDAVIRLMSSHPFIRVDLLLFLLPLRLPLQL